MVETMVRSGQLLDQSGLAGDGSLNVAVKMPGAWLIYWQTSWGKTSHLGSK